MTAGVRVLVLGADGQVGKELCGALSCFAKVIAATEADFDMTRAAKLREAIDGATPDVIVNAAAYTDVDGAERDKDRAMAVNADAVAILGREVLRRRVGLIHYSTDFVFDGNKGSTYSEQDVPAPLNEYGRSKLVGERALSELGAPAIVLRTAWVYSLTNKSFVSSILRLARERELLRIVSDQVGNPTFSRDLACATALILYGIRAAPFDAIQAAKGVYHLAGSGSCSRWELACAAVALDPNRHEHRLKSIEPISTDQYPLPAIRPRSAPLDCSLVQSRFGISLPDWKDSLRRALGA